MRFTVENYGDSPLAKRFGVKRYPAIFVNDVLVATPKDFGFFGDGEGEKSGRYAPLRSAASHERFRSDLEKVIRLMLAGRTAEARRLVPQQATAPLGALPAFTASDVFGAAVRSKDFAGRVVIVDFWATWCPPCRAAMPWIRDLKKKHGDDVVVLTVAIDSDPAEVAKLTKSLGVPVTAIAATPEIARAFGDISAVPTMFVFDRRGKGVDAFYGAPPTLHDDVAAAVARARVIVR
ncbi:MAG TPA: TlpA disulfide reductase family protein [Thermoanaerobaculia bacterium]|nr:TlpA disulfide reductase family protein [Thermoanaerobaculia bacterium]